MSESNGRGKLHGRNSLAAFQCFAEQKIGMIVRRCDVTNFVLIVVDQGQINTERFHRIGAERFRVPLKNFENFFVQMFGIARRKFFEPFDPLVSRVGARAIGSAQLKMETFDVRTETMQRSDQTCGC